jgi:hypothetical protein
MLTKFTPNKSRTRIVITQHSPGRRKVLGTIRPLSPRGDRGSPVFVAARPLTAAQLDSVLAIMAG